MRKRINDFKIIDNKVLNKDFYSLELFSGEALPDIYPGQFAQVLVENSPGTFLRRPFSFHEVDYKKNTIKFLIQITGKGTQALSLLKKGDSLNLVYPLGKPFSLPLKDDKTLLIGGGCGVGPLFYLAKYLKLHDFKCDILMGFRSLDRIIEYKEYKKLGQVFITTEDGSEGERGKVIDHSVLKKANYSRIYCCGPDSMMKVIAEYSRENNIICEVSLENLMACGVGVCLCCVVNTINGNVCSCTDGPVFNINELKW